MYLWSIYRPIGDDGGMKWFYIFYEKVHFAEEGEAGEKGKDGKVRNSSAPPGMRMNWTVYLHRYLKLGEPGPIGEIGKQGKKGEVGKDGAK